MFQVWGRTDTILKDTNPNPHYNRFVQKTAAISLWPFYNKTQKFSCFTQAVALQQNILQHIRQGLFTYTYTYIYTIIVISDSIQKTNSPLKQFKSTDFQKILRKSIDMGKYYLIKAISFLALKTDDSLFHL